MHKNTVQNKFLKRLCGIMLLAMVLTVTLIFVLQTRLAITEAKNTEIVQVLQATTKMADNNNEISSLKESLNVESIAKANAFSLMIDADPSILESQFKLEHIKELLNVDELHVTNEKGLLLWGTEPSMFGFDLGSGDQSRPFLEGIKNKSFTLAQEPQLNARNNELFQYVGVSRQKVAGIVQIGLRPQRLQAALKSNEIENVLSGILVGSNGYIFAIDKATGNFLYHKDSSRLGKSALDAGLSKSVLDGKKTEGFTKMAGEKVHYSTQEHDNILFGAVMPKSEVYRDRNIVTVIFLISTAVIFIFLIFVINRMIKKDIVVGLHSICKDLSRITSGDTDVVVSERTNEEFDLLSNGINEMLESIKSKMELSEQLAQKEIASFREVKGVSQNINGISKGMLAVSQTLAQGVQEQLYAADNLSKSFQNVSNNISTTAEKAKVAQNLSVMVGGKLINGNLEMDKMLQSMNEISEHSKQISNIIKSIEDIAFQTNILALNAAVEAARAGAAGQGFSVVAEEVRNLASKSSVSAKSTAALIEETLRSVKNGSTNALQTAKTFSDIIQDADKSAQLIESIATLATEQALLVTDVEREMEQIGTVAHNNSQTAKVSETSSIELSGQIESLELLISR